MTIHIGFTGTRHGMSTAQRDVVVRIVSNTIDEYGKFELRCHHGLCVGADEDFHSIVRDRDLDVVGHPGPDWPDGELCAYTICGHVLDPMPHMRRNRAIVNVSSIVIATPLENTEQRRGGTWATIRMARKAAHRPKLYVVGRDGVLLP